MNRLAAALLLILLIAPGFAGAGELARASGPTIDAAPATVGISVHPRSTPGRLLYGGPILDLESRDVPPLVDPAEAKDVGRALFSLALGTDHRPCPPGCVPTSQRLPYHATAPPALG